MTPAHDVDAVARRSPLDLTFEQTVPRSLVHRTALAEVYVADSVQTGEDEFALAVQVPRAHCVWFDRRAPYHDPLSTAEAARQGVYVVVHRHVGVPPRTTFSMQRLELRVVSLNAYRDDGRSPLQGVLALRLVERVGSGGAFGSMYFEGRLSVGGAVAMTMAGDLAFMPPDDYAALRAYHRRRNPLAGPRGPVGGPAIAAFEHGRRDQRNSVLAGPDADWTCDGAARYAVIVDQEHPSFFDHRYDHVPGPLIIEAYRQAAVVTAHRAGALPSPVAAITGCKVAFTDFAELDARIDCIAAVDDAVDGGGVGVTVGLEQFGKAISTGRVELCPYPDDTPVS
jgi:A-factor biosynthesis hotdog domain